MHSVPSSRVSEENKSDSNCCPRSVVIVEGQPYPSIYEVAGNCLRRNRRDGNSFGPSSKAIYAREYVIIPMRRRQWSYNVDVNVIKASIRRSEGTDRSHYVPMHFRSLTL